MIQMMRALGATAVVVASCMGSPAVAQTKQLTLCWAAWDPANALVELSKDFTAKTGIQMKYEFVPWTSYADRFLNELNSKGKLCDVIIGDSQWIGGAAENGQYVKLNDFFKKEGISMDDYMPATVVGYSEWPKNTPNYWALPAMGDAIGWTYRKDWFARPEIQAEFKKKYGRDLRMWGGVDKRALAMGHDATDARCGFLPRPCHQHRCARNPGSRGCRGCTAANRGAAKSRSRVRTQGPLRDTHRDSCSRCRW